jgi:MFS family permease
MSFIEVLRVCFCDLTGPLLLRHFFDNIGRVPMIAGCYLTSGALLALSGYLFYKDVLSSVTLTASWTAMFFFASSAASAAYLTVSEVFPMEIRAIAIAAFYAIATGLGGSRIPSSSANLSARVTGRTCSSVSGSRRPS